MRPLFGTKDLIYLKHITVQTISIDELRDFLNSFEFPIRPIQKKICFPIIQRIYRKTIIEVQFENINIDNSLLINGHHRYLCSLLSFKNIDTNKWKSPSQIAPLQWNEIEIDLEDWESIEIINRHNFLDAARNNIDVKTLEDLT